MFRQAPIDQSDARAGTLGFAQQIGPEFGFHRNKELAAELTLKTRRTTQGRSIGAAIISLSHFIFYGIGDRLGRHDAQKDLRACACPGAFRRKVSIALTSPKETA